MATGIIFGLLAVAHVWRMIAEAPRLATDPFYLAITLVAGALGVWAAVLLRRSRAA